MINIISHVWIVSSFYYHPFSGDYFPYKFVKCKQSRLIHHRYHYHLLLVVVLHFHYHHFTIIIIISISSISSNRFYLTLFFWSWCQSVVSNRYKICWHLRQLINVWQFHVAININSKVVIRSFSWSLTDSVIWWQSATQMLS